MVRNVRTNGPQLAASFAMPIRVTSREALARNSAQQGGINSSPLFKSSKNTLHCSIDLCQNPNDRNRRSLVERFLVEPTTARLGSFGAHFQFVIAAPPPPGT
jgi:hypothetical protein